MLDARVADGRVILWLRQAFDAAGTAPTRARQRSCNASLMTGHLPPAASIAVKTTSSSLMSTSVLHQRRPEPLPHQQRIQQRRLLGVDPGRQIKAFFAGPSLQRPGWRRPRWEWTRRARLHAPVRHAARATAVQAASSHLG
jgi:hypothetical protein